MRTLVSLIGFFFAGTAALAAETGDELYRRLSIRGADSVAALGEVLVRPNEQQAIVLLFAAGVAHREKRLEDAGFLFHAGLMRAHFDRAMFPPVGTGGNSPMLVFGALQHTMGPELQSAVADEPKVYAAVAERLKNWRPETSSEYEPGWEYSERKAPGAVDAVMTPQFAEKKANLTALASLLQDELYFAAFQTAKRFNKIPLKDRKTDAGYDAAMETMSRIETERGVKGFSRALSPSSVPVGKK